MATPVIKSSNYTSLPSYYKRYTFDIDRYIYIAFKLRFRYHLLKQFCYYKGLAIVW